MLNNVKHLGLIHRPSATLNLVYSLSKHIESWPKQKVQLQSKSLVNCILCLAKANFYCTDEISMHNYFHCPECDLRFIDPTKRLNPPEELVRYQLHENDVTDIKYQNYMKPMFEWVKEHYPSGSQGLDFGCGSGPLLAQMLTEQGYDMTLYDPYFYPNTSHTKNRYDFVVSIEAAEHFYSPAKEFLHLKNLLKHTGGLGVVTSLYNDTIDFNSWYYRRDPTHVCFYSKNTFDWIKNKFQFRSYQTNGARLNWLSC